MSDPHSTPFEVVYDGRGSSGASRWNGPDYTWQPGSVTDDPHDDFEGDDLEVGPTPPNIVV